MRKLVVAFNEVYFGVVSVVGRCSEGVVSRRLGGIGYVVCIIIIIIINRRRRLLRRGLGVGRITVFAQLLCVETWPLQRV
jgi:hypothetical protein